MKKPSIGWQSWSLEPSFWTRYLTWGKMPVAEFRPRRIELPVKKRFEKNVRYWCSWYAFGQNIGHKKMLKVAQKIKKYRIMITHLIIDDGWTRWGDWHWPDPSKFPDFKKTVKKINKKKVDVGLWFAPFLASRKSNLYKIHPDWFVWYKGKLVNGIKAHPLIDWFLPKKYLLDYSLPQVRSYITDFIDKAILEWDVKLLKIDFLYAIYFDPRYKDDRRAHQAINWLLGYIKRKYPEVLVLASAAPYSPVSQLTDMVRIGTDNAFPPTFPSIFNKHIYRYQINRLKTKLASIIFPRQLVSDLDVRIIDYDNRITKKFWDKVDRRVLGVGDDLLKLSKEKLIELREWLGR